MHLTRPLSLSLAGLLALAATARADVVRVGAAISLKDALGEIVADYQRESGDTVELTFGSSGQIQQQIRSGAEMDAFVSAANKQVDELVRDGLADAATRRVVVGNTLVLVVPADAADPPTGFVDLADAKVKKLAVGEPKTVPAGQYAAQVLNALKLDAALADRVVYGTNVRQVLTYVERGEVSAGIVYGSDARESGGKVRVVATADAATHEPIVYPGIVLTHAKQQAAARRFLDRLSTAKARATFVAKGFVAPADLPAAPATTRSSVPGPSVPGSSVPGSSAR